MDRQGKIMMGLFWIGLGFVGTLGGCICLGIPVMAYGALLFLEAAGEPPSTSPNKKSWL